jgi:DNA helicase-2/ATP-dependent DNA helicase PcrA
MINFDNIIQNSKTYKLTSNYRSTKIIVKMANKSISWNKNRVEKKMVYSIKEKSVKPVLAICETDKFKYNYVIKKIKKFIEMGYGYGDIAILSRNTYPLKCMETELTKNSIPHVALITDKNSDDNKSNDDKSYKFEAYDKNGNKVIINLPPPPKFNLKNPLEEFKNAKSK